MSNHAPALDRGLRLVAVIAASADGCSFGDLARHLGVANTVATRLLHVLMDHDWVTKGARMAATDSAAQQRRCSLIR